MLKEYLREIQSIDASEYPVIDIVWKPHGAGSYDISSVEVYMGLSGVSAKAHETLVELFANVASIPCAVFTEEGVTAIDEAGALPLTMEDGVGKMGFPFHYWKPERDTVGCIVLHYCFYPRKVPYDYRFRPYYDFRTENFGATGAGCTTLLAPKDQQYNIRIRWDLSDLPADAEAVAVRGEGDHQYVGVPIDYQFTMYAVGKIKKYATEDGRYAIYWLNEPLPDEERIKRDIPRILSAMAKQFDDPSAHYSVFFRKDPFKMSNGATAFDHGFIYGYSDEKPLVWEHAMDIFAHEVVHTWAMMEDRPGMDGESTWYREGTAEWYNIKILNALGITDETYMAQQISWRGLLYYANPYISTPNTVAWKDSWTKRQAQQLPYGRGFFYLQEVDRRMKEVSCGKKSLDDMVSSLLHLGREMGRCPTVADWEELLRQELGEADVSYFHEVSNGKIIEPDERWFDGRFTIARGEVYEPVRELCENSYVWTPKTSRQIETAMTK